MMVKKTGPKHYKYDGFENGMFEIVHLQSIMRRETVESQEEIPISDPLPHRLE
jgi:hypothetical protein